MPSFMIAIAAFVAATLPAVQAGGSAIVQNHCGFAVAVWPIDIVRKSTTPIMVGSGSSYSETYHTPASGGVSIKVAKSSAGGPITQLEYTIGDGIFYDVSNIDCSGSSCPFQPYGMYLQSGSGCPTVSCSAGATICDGAYNNPDDVRTLACMQGSADTTLHLCATGAGYSRSINTTETAPASAAEYAVAAPAYTTLLTRTVVASTTATATVHGHGHGRPSPRAIQHPHARR